MGGSYTGSDTEGAVNVDVTNGRPRRDVTLGRGQGQRVTPTTYGSHPRGHAGASGGAFICSTCPHTSHRQGPPIPEPRHRCQKFCSRNVFSAVPLRCPGPLVPEAFYCLHFPHAQHPVIKNCPHPSVLGKVFLCPTASTRVNNFFWMRQYVHFVAKTSKHHKNACEAFGSHLCPLRPYSF